MDDLIEEISKRLGPRWVSVVTRLKFLTPNGRFQIESRYNHLKDKQPVLYHRMCSMDCITQWLSSVKNQKLDEREKKQKLFTEMYSIVDFKGFVRELADAEGIALPLEEAGVGDRVLAGARLTPSPIVTESSPDFRIDVTTESTTRSATFESPQAQDTAAKGGNVSPLLSLAGPVSYGDSSLQSKASVSLATHGGVSVGKPQVYVTPSTNGASVGVRQDQTSHASKRQDQWLGEDEVRVPHPLSKPRGSFDGVPPEESSISSSSTHGSSSLSTGALGDADSSTSHCSTSEGDDYSDGDNLDTLTHESAMQSIYSVPINVTIKKHKFAILDICQRLPFAKWEEIGIKLGMESAFIDDLSKEEEIEERFYAMIMKRIEIGDGRMTFLDLRDIIKDEETALLVLEERLEGQEGQEILIRAIQQDLLIA